jgi:hypothetical protein
VNGFVDFVPGAATAGGCDFTGTFGDFGCAAPTVTARPRIDVNHGSMDFGVAPAPPLVADLTLEIAPFGPTWPGRHIYRWKNAMSFATAPGSANTRSSTLELWYDSRIVVVRERAANTVVTALQDQVGIGPGIAGQGYGGPPPGACPVGPGVLLAPLWGTPGFTALPGDMIAMDSVADSAALSNLAVVFTPGPGVPVPYTVTVY